MDFSAAHRIMVDSQIRPNDVTEPALVAAIMNVAREAFVPASRKAVAYSELKIETSEGRALWTPRDFSKLLKIAEPQRADIALIIGAGAGYEVAVLAGMVETVIGLEDDESVVEATTARLAEQGADRAVMVQGELGKGLADQGPFDIIFVNGMVETVPDAWTDQLAENGRLAVVVQAGRDLGEARIYKRSGKTLSYRVAFEASPPKFDAFDATKSFAF